MQTVKWEQNCYNSLGRKDEFFTGFLFLFLYIFFLVENPI